jgi:uncharacterized membrane protein
MLRLMGAGFAIIVAYCASQWITLMMDRGTELLQAVEAVHG